MQTYYSILLFQFCPHMVNVYNEILYSEVPISRNLVPHFASAYFTVILLLYFANELPISQSTFGFPLIEGSRNRDTTVLTLLN